MYDKNTFYSLLKRINNALDLIEETENDPKEELKENGKLNLGFGGNFDEYQEMEKRFEELTDHQVAVIFRLILWKARTEESAWKWFLKKKKL